MKNIVDLTKILFMAAIIVLLVMFGNRFIQQSIQYDQFMGDTIQHFEQIIGEDSAIIARQEQRIGTLEQAIEAGMIEKESLKRANIDRAEKIISLQAELEYLNVRLSFKPDTVYQYDTIRIQGYSYLRMPMPFAQDIDPWTYIDGMVTTSGVNINRLNIRQEPTIVLGYQTQGYFKPAIPIVVYTDANPRLAPVEMRNITISEPLPWYHSPWIRRLEGFLIGVGTVKGIQWAASK